MAGTTETIQQGPIVSRQRQLQARYNLMRSESLRDTSLPSSLPSSTTPSGTPSANIRTPSLSNTAALGRATGQALRAPIAQFYGKKLAAKAGLKLGGGALGGAMAGLGSLAAAAGVMMAVGGLAQHFFGRKIKQSTLNRFKLIGIANEVFDEFSFGHTTKDKKTRFASRWGNKLEHYPREQIVKLISGARIKAQEAVRKDAIAYKAGKPTTAEQGEIDRLKTLIDQRLKSGNNREVYAQKQKLRKLEQSITKRTLQQKNLNLKAQHFFNKTVPNQKDPALLIPHFEKFLEQDIGTFDNQMAQQEQLQSTQEQPPAQEPPTQGRSLAENAFNVFKGIGIGSAISRNVFNPKRLSRPDLGFGFQKLFSRQQY